MHKRLFTTIAGVLMLSSPCFAVQQEKTMTVQVSHALSTFVIKLPANPTTGFQWKLVQYDTSLFKLVSSIYEAEKTNLIGSGGATLFTFQLQSGKVYPKDTQMLFRYQRPWTASDATKTEVTIKFD